MPPTCFLIPCPHGFPPNISYLIHLPSTHPNPGSSIQPCPKGPSHTLSPLIMSMGASPLALRPSPPPIPRSALLGCSLWGPHCPLLTVPQGESMLPSSTGSASRAQAPDCPSEVPSLSRLLPVSPLVPGPHLCPLLRAPPQLPWLTDHGCRKHPVWQPPLNRVRPKLSLQVNTMLL